MADMIFGQEEHLFELLKGYILGKVLVKIVDYRAHLILLFGMYLLAGIGKQAADGLQKEEERRFDKPFTLVGGHFGIGRKIAEPFKKTAYVLICCGSEVDMGAGLFAQLVKQIFSSPGPEKILNKTALEMNYIALARSILIVDKLVKIILIDKTSSLALTA